MRHALPLIALLMVQLATAAPTAPKKKKLPPKRAAESVWVVRSDGGKQCAPGTEEPIEKAIEELKRAKIQVLDSKKGSDGKMRIQMCGAPTGRTNSFLIQKTDLPLAQGLGFKEASPEIP